MVKGCSKLLAIAAILLFVITACSSSNEPQEPIQENRPSEQAEPQPSENARSDESDGISEPNEVSETDHELNPSNENDSVNIQPSNNDEANQSESSASSDPESAPEPDVIPFVTLDEEASIVPLQAGQQYPEGTLVGSADIGIAFTIPQDWTGVLPEGAPSFLLASETRPGLVIMASQASNSVDEIVELLSQPVPIDEGVVIHPEGQPVIDGPWIGVSVTATDGINEFDGYAMALVRESGTGIFIVAIGPEPDEYYKGLASEIAVSTKAAKTTVAADQSASVGVDSSDSSALEREWTQFFAGMRATYLSSYSSGTSGGFSDKSEFDFCSDGQFVQSGSSSLSVDTMGASAFSGGTSGGSGNWKIVAQGDRVFLELNWSDGNVGQILLEYVDSKTYFNGERYFITPDNTTCR